MSLSFDILRPDDLVVLHFDAENLRLDAKDPRNAKLVVEKAGKPAYLVVGFQPQSIFEKAYFETAQTAANPNNPPPPVPDPASTQEPDSAGSVPARMAGPSRLVFKVPVNAQIPLNIAALLDWLDFECVVSATAVGNPPATITAPGPLETAIEMPYRLILSPGTGAGWAHTTTPETFAGRTALWHTRLSTLKKVKTKTGTVNQLNEAGAKNQIPLRAIWSPDFVDHGVLPAFADNGPFLAAMSPRDRAELVILTSAKTGYFSSFPGALLQWDPQPVEATRLFLSSLGGWLSSRGDWTELPYYKASDGSMQALELVEWCHQATQGRDHYVRIVYEGFLYPFGHRASLVKVTERKFIPPDGANVSSVTAYLKQHMYIVVREPEKTYPGASFQHAGREMPFAANVKIKTAVTPDIDLPQYFKDGATSLASFWINVGDVPFPFHIAATDLAGATINFIAPLIFMAQSEAEPAFIQGQYANSGDTRRCVVKGSKIAYADPAAGDTTLKTDGLFFTSEILQSGPPYSAAPFIPSLDSAQVTIPSLEQLLGITTPVTIELYKPYVNGGLDNNAGVFADIVSTPAPALQFSADQAGGFATPNMTLTSLSARKGLVAGGADDAAAGWFNPSAVFGNVQAQLFGTIPLGNLIPTTSGKAPAAQNAPEIRSKLLPNSKNPTSVSTHIQWSPQLTDFNAGPVTVEFNRNGASALTLKAVVERNLTGGPPTSQVSGELSNFQLSLFDVVELTVKSIKFSSVNGQKTNVVCTLPSSSPVNFTGPLGFVQQLAEILPPGIFGGSGGPKIELQPKQLRVTLTIGLPTISVGVFSLEHISFMAGLDLPYLNGKPAFEFAFASRNSPFLLTVECIGGGGFIHLIVDTDGVEMVEGALEFGAEISFDVGIASGGVHIMAGIYFQLKQNYSDITGFVDIGGEVSILGIISISMDLNLSLSYQVSNGKSSVQGKATLSVSIHIIFFSISASVSVEKSFGNSSGDPRVADVLTPADWAEYALAFAGGQ